MADGARVVVVGGGDLLVGVGAARECHRQRRGALLPVPRELALLRRAADGHRVDARGVPVAVAVVPLLTAVPGGPHVDHALPLATIRDTILERFRC